MRFIDEFEKYAHRSDEIVASVNNTSKREVLRILDRVEQSVRPGNGLFGKKVPMESFGALLSPEAADSSVLERMARVAHVIKQHHFGNAMFLFTPMYLSNFCNNGCIYCGFHRSTDISRHKMSLDEVRAEAEKISETGLKHILILTGDAPQKASVEYIAACCKVLKPYFSSISMEMFAMTTEEYRTLVEAGVDGLTIYQETYNESLYKKLHPIGPKKKFHFRLEAPERGAAAGMRNINIGALLGLDAWQKDIFFTALHAGWLESRFPEVEISISLPRMRPHVGSYQPACTVSDRDMVQMMTALRIFLPRCGITVSTRESQCFRNHILQLGITKISAGSTTAVGGHTASKSDGRTPQFEISDTRSVEEMTTFLVQQGIQPVYKDWERF